MYWQNVRLNMFLLRSLQLFPVSASTLFQCCFRWASNEPKIKLDGIIHNPDMK